MTMQYYNNNNNYQFQNEDFNNDYYLSYTKEIFDLVKNKFIVGSREYFIFTKSQEYYLWLINYILWYVSEYDTFDIGYIYILTDFDHYLLKLVIEVINERLHMVYKVSLESNTILVDYKLIDN
jgi:hypothetical protein